MSKIEAVCPYCKKQNVVEKNHFGVGEHAHGLQDSSARTARRVGNRIRALRWPSQCYLENWQSYASRCTASWMS